MRRVHSVCVPTTRATSDLYSYTHTHAQIDIDIYIYRCIYMRKSGARAVMEAFDEASALGLRADDAGYK